MQSQKQSEQLSPWWRQAVILVLILGFTVLIVLAIKTYQDAPPIPDKVTTDLLNQPATVACRPSTSMTRRNLSN
jgi:nitric oxide reductase large subunit